MGLRIAITLMSLLFLSAIPSAFGRGVVYFGEHQRVQKGHATARVQATIAIPGGVRKKGAPYKVRCTVQSAGNGDNPLTVIFRSSECIRKGTHVLCFKDEAVDSGELVTQVCWGDIYNKPRKKTSPKGD